MAESLRFTDLVQERIDRALEAHASHLAEIAPELADITRIAGDLLQGGKRFRALFCYWGWQAVAGLEDEEGPLDSGRSAEHLPAVVEVAAALEIFHAAALVHDDIMDNSDLRRGRPSAHRRFEAIAHELGLAGDRAAFGRNGALLLGDLLLGWSDELLDEGLRRLDDGARIAARLEFTRMRTEVTLGQHLDILEEGSWRGRDDEDLIRRAHRVILFKAAKYSVEAPLAIGASLAGASLPQLEALRAYGLPVGVAFQLQDDLLGVYGDPAETGKPAGDDLREGKRTVLIALARQALPPSAARLLDELLGDPELDAGQISMLQSTVRDSGAVAKVDRIIGHSVRTARAALGQAPLSRAAREELSRLADAVTRRSS
ncbi:polyprenyl synthetase family protein [Homoserinibacter sp. YIM 151385]|uniref:polyprenyl synthetase family protein n=1 Tax=Homoserinibacter sp. YIM 151385 TaxID=2985506 RepID=UPI0022F063C8|nr:polyprenyl synthetase family protein [Homoserinibacter sp. YIM 151385]WBU38750.1 polyprenyl synthetase family protein [Homoserinibacter sp. YIM 151385]